MMMYVVMAFLGALCYGMGLRHGQWIGAHDERRRWIEAVMERTQMGPESAAEGATSLTAMREGNGHG